jgi:hypothetical protein
MFEIGTMFQISIDLSMISDRANVPLLLKGGGAIGGMKIGCSNLKWMEIPRMKWIVNSG